MASFQMKDGLALPAIDYLTQVFSQAYPQFAKAEFRQHLWPKVDELELKQRVHLIIEGLGQALPSSFEACAPILRHVKDIWNAPKTSSFDVFVAWPVIDFVAVKGIDHPQLSLSLLESLTELFSAEFAIRPFLNRYPELVLNKMKSWVTHDSEHVRRLVSEGTRPFLPWASRVPGLANYFSQVLDLLTSLHADPSLYVRRSVANHVNDLSKNYPDEVLDLLRNWDQLGQPNTPWLKRHALRTLIKKGHPEALALLGFDPQAPIQCELFLERNKISIGEPIVFNVTLESKQPSPYMLDFIIGFNKSSGSQTEKVFKWSSGQVNGSLRLQKQFLFVHRTTRKLYPGHHYLKIQVNGRVQAEATFKLKA